MSYVPHIPARVLEAAGAWYTGATALALRGAWRPDSTGEINIVVTYTKGPGSTNGRVKARVFWTEIDASNNEREIPDVIPNGTVTASGTVATQDVYTAVYDLKATIDGTAVRVMIPLRAPRNANKIRVEIAEAGDTASGHEGTAAVDVEGKL